MLHEIALDIDQDGKMDRAVLAKPQPELPDADLYIYLALGDEKVDLSRKPAILKKAIATDAIEGLESAGKGSLIVKYGWGGSNTYEAKLTIVHRRGAFWVAGFTKSWDRRDGIGSCDINFLTGKGVVSRGPSGKDRPMGAKFKPVKLADWSPDKHAKACDF